MSLRPPASLSSLAAREAALGAIDAEVMAEQASSLARAGRKLEAALADLSAFDAATESTKGKTDRGTLLADARKALWYLVVQREACGLRSSSEVIAAYGVPAEVSAGVTTMPIIWRRRR